MIVNSCSIPNRSIDAKRPKVGWWPITRTVPVASGQPQGRQDIDGIGAWRQLVQGVELAPQALSGFLGAHGRTNQDACLAGQMLVEPLADLSRLSVTERGERPAHVVEALMGLGMTQ